MMRRYFPGHWSQWLGAGAGLLLLAIVGALAVAYSGIYNVAASVPHSGPVFDFLQLTRDRSVAAHAKDVGEPPPISEAALVARGATHYDRVCSFCHGAPGQPRSPTVHHMLPQPPLLAELVADRSPQELFWVVHNGLKFSGMPGWPAPKRDDEVWALVSFIKKLPGMSESEYRALAETPEAVSPEAAPSGGVASDGGVDLVSTSAPSAQQPERLATCVQCHGANGLGRGVGAFPILGLQTERYLHQSLRAFADGDRISGIMGSVAVTLTEDDMAQLAAYYSRSGVPESPVVGDAPQALIDQGRQIVESGIPESNVVPCASCHRILKGNDNFEDQIYPQLAGQYADYTATQLLAWRNGSRGEVRSGDSMKAESHHLSDDAIAAIAAYYASLTPEAPPPAAGDQQGG